MEHHEGLKIYVNEGMTDRMRLGVISVVHNVRVTFWVERDANKFTLTATDRYADDDIEWHVVYFDVDQDSLPENTLTRIAKEFDDMLVYLHENVRLCEHCNIAFGSDPTELVEHGFKSIDLCSNCGIQAIYDKKFSEETCCICMDPIGFGHFAVLCRNTKHKIHLGCVREQIVCPMCRGSNESDSEEEYESEED